MVMRKMPRWTWLAFRLGVVGLEKNGHPVVTVSPQKGQYVHKPRFLCVYIYIHTWIFLLCVKFLPKKPYQKAEILHIWKIQVDVYVGSVSGAFQEL